MARLTGAIYGLLVLALSQYAAAQTVHVVGDNIGWAVPQQGGANAYVTWANGKTFSVGDILTFDFATNEHDVLRVPRESFDACSESNEIGDIIKTGPVNITLDAAGEHYYICTIGRHCAAGQKLAITVSGTPGASPPSATPAPATPTPPATPSPTSNSPDDCAPTPTPAGSTNPGSQGPTTSFPPPPGSSSSKALASVLVSAGAIMMAMLF